MKTVRVELGRRGYDILIGPGLLDRAAGIFDRYRIHRRVFIVSNPVVFELYGPRLVKVLSEGGYEAGEILIPDGEKNKNLETVEHAYALLLAQRIDRSCTVLALGGGVTGDVAGFVAATVLRGIPYIQFPTTLLAQVDSSVGGKTGVNHRLGKNLIGAFYQPGLVCVDTDTLSSLPDREFQSGLYEVLKYGLICDADFFGFLEESMGRIRDRESSVLEAVISRCCEIKAEVTATDETEAGLRRILNFGHTVGHGIEAATGYELLTHGEAIGWGMIAETYLSEMMGWIDEPTCARIVRGVRELGPLPSIDQIPQEALLQAMASDKKRRDGQSVFVLLAAIGQTRITQEVEERLLLEAWDRTLQWSTRPPGG